MKTTIPNIFKLTIILVSLSACSAPSAQKEIVTEKITPNIDIKNCICPEVWMPVCGDNGKTYSNACFANCAGVKFVQGSCVKVITD